MDTHRSRSLGMAALIFILISLTVAVFHGAAPVRADDVTTPTPIEINGDAATVEVKLYTDENHTQELNGAVTSTSKLYGAFSAQFKSGEAPSPENYIAHMTQSAVKSHNGPADRLQSVGGACR